MASLAKFFNSRTGVFHMHIPVCRTGIIFKRNMADGYSDNSHFHAGAARRSKNPRHAAVDKQGIELPSDGIPSSHAGHSARVFIQDTPFEGQSGFSRHHREAFS
jgi:hypothetical protein